MKSNLFLLFFLFCAGALTAQVSIGFRAGVLGCTIVQNSSEVDAPELQRLGSFQAAIPIEIAIGQSFAVQPEIMYGTLGSKFEILNKSEPEGTDGTLLEVTLSGRSRTTIIEVPVLGKLKFGSDRLRFFLQAGPSVAMGLRGKSTAKGVIRVIKDDKVLNGFEVNEKATAKFVKNGYASAEISDDQYAAPRFSTHLHFGGGVLLQLGRIGLLFDARYILGLSDVSVEVEGTPQDQKYSDKSRRIGLSMGVMVPLGVR